MITELLLESQVNSSESLTLTWNRAVSKVLMTGPLAPFADAYALELKQRCYTPLTSVVQLRQVARLSNWLEVRGLGVAELNGERVTPRSPKPCCATRTGTPRTCVSTAKAVPEVHVPGDGRSRCGCRARW